MAENAAVFTFVGNNGESLHRALCSALGISPGHGSKSHVAQALDVRTQRYSRIVARSVCAIEPTAQLCEAAGVRMLLHDGTVYFFAPGEAIPASLAAAA